MIDQSQLKTNETIVEILYKPLFYCLELWTIDKYGGDLNEQQGKVTSDRRLLVILQYTLIFFTIFSASKDRWWAWNSAEKHFEWVTMVGIFFQPTTHAPKCPFKDFSQPFLSVFFFPLFSLSVN